MSAADTESSARILEEAASWLEKIERTIGADEGKALRSWLGSKAHREAIVERCKRWHGPEILAVLGELIPVETFNERVERHYGRLLLAIVLGVIALGTMTVMITAARFFPGADARGNPLRAESFHETGVGERKTINLPDGGAIVMNTQSRARLVYRPRYRDAALVTGEATFDVKYDPARPFVVSASARAFEVQPGGARFNLRKITDDQVELTVFEGQVRVPATRLASVTPALLRSRVTYGERLFVAPEAGRIGVGWQSVWSPSPKELERRAAWQSGRVIFDDEYLKDALAEIERYTPVKFLFSDRELGRTRLSGEFEIGDVDAIRRHLKEHLGIDSKMSGRTNIVLVRSGSPTSEEAAKTYIDCLSNDSCRRLNDDPHLTL